MAYVALPSPRPAPALVPRLGEASAETGKDHDHHHHADHHQVDQGMDDEGEGDHGQAPDHWQQRRPAALAGLFGR
ncbi:MAG: hypothetical protein ACYDH5_17930 [Acidimicrobiales bacterium]